MRDSDQPVIVLTGANGGVGVELARYLLRARVGTLALTFRSRNDEILNVLREFDLEPERCLFQVDLSAEDQARKLRLDVEGRLGLPYAVINLAGASTNALSWKMTVGTFESVVRDNLLSTFLCCREFIPGMRERGAGRIINISSVVASIGRAGASHYAAAKAGIEGFTRSMALELAPKSITANAIALGYFQYGLINHLSAELQNSIREQIPLKRFGNCSEIGGLVTFLLSEAGAYTTGQVIHVNGGLC